MPLPYSLHVSAYGASGGPLLNGMGRGSLGDYVQCSCTIGTDGLQFHVRVGGAGDANGTGGWNGGGSGGALFPGGIGGGGGGMTSILVGLPGGPLSQLVVAGGGGGGGVPSGCLGGGAGGGIDPVQNMATICASTSIGETRGRGGGGGAGALGPGGGPWTGAAGGMNYIDSSCTVHSNALGTHMGDGEVAITCNAPVG